MRHDKTDTTTGSLVLVVDDDHHNLFMLQRRLESHNYRVKTASSGRAAIDMAGEEPPDLILLDVSMPEMDGFEIKQQLNQSDEMMHIPVIFHSDRIQLEYKIQAFDLGAVDFIAKPFHPEELLARVDVALRQFHREKHLVEEIARLEEHMRTGGLEGVDEEEALDKLERSIQMAESRKESISALNVKVNGLDNLNNPALQRVILMEVSEVLQEMVNTSTDTVIAFKEPGEYLLYAVGMPLKRAQILAEGLKSSIMVRAFSDPSAEASLTVGMGIAGRDPGSGIDKDALLTGATEAQRQASAAGGNRTVVKRFDD